MLGRLLVMYRLHQILVLPPLVALFSCGPAAPGAGEPGEAEAALPDIVVYLVDTLRADRTGPGGNPGAMTPTLDGLASLGVVFEEAHAAGPWTLPSIMSMFTGLHLAEHNVVMERRKLSAATPVLTEMLAEGGYSTASFHANAFAGVRFGLDRGFDLCELISGKPITGKVIGAMFDQLESPYFLYVHSVEPHDPDLSYRPHADRVRPVSKEFLKDYRGLVKGYRSLTRADYVAGKPLGTTDNSEAQEKAMGRLTAYKDDVEVIYSGSVSVADERIRSVIGEIQKRGRWDETLFIVVSDHGEEMADHGGWQHDQSVYQELMHVPMVMHFPGGEFAGTRVKAPVSLVDLAPTILDYLGDDLGRRSLSGRSLMPLARGEATGSGPRIVGMRHNVRKYYRPYKETRGDINIAVRDGRWKGILNVELGTFELYDLERDAGEQANLVSEEPGVAARLEAFAVEGYKGLLVRAQDVVEGGGAPLDAATKKSLQALGYIGGEEEE